MFVGLRRVCFLWFPNPPRCLLYRVLEPLGPFIVGTWGVRGLPVLNHCTLLSGLKRLLNPVEAPCLTAGSSIPEP